MLIVLVGFLGVRPPVPTPRHRPSLGMWPRLDVEITDGYYMGLAGMADNNLPQG